jgi:hypothetical protein
MCFPPPVPTVTGAGSAIHPGTGRKLRLHSHRCATGPAARWQFQQSVGTSFVFVRAPPDFLLIFQNLVDDVQQIGDCHHIYRGRSVQLALHQALERTHDPVVNAFAIAAVVNRFAVPQPVYTIKPFSANVVTGHSPFAFHFVFLRPSFAPIPSHSPMMRPGRKKLKKQPK